MVINTASSTTPASLRKTHRGMILSRIQTEPGISRADLARMCGFSEMAATRIVRELLAAGIIEEFDASRQGKPSRKKRVGRPKTGLRIVADGLFAVGITVSAYHSEVSICDANGRLFASSRTDSVSFDTVSGAAQFYARALKDLIETSDVDVDRIVGVGVALSARTDPERHEIVTAEYFGWSHDGGQFCREIRRIVNLPVEIENISNALAIAEMRFGAAREASDFTLIHAATFVGAGVVSDKRLVRGHRGISGSLGHFRAAERPLTCVCGRHDCLNLSATGFALLSRLGKLDHRAFDTSKLSFYAESLLAALKDPAAADLVTQTGASLAPALDSVAKLLGPEMIILSGYLGSNPAYFGAARDALARQFGHAEGAPCQLVRGTISPVESAALLALHCFCYSDQLDYDRFARTADPDLMSQYG